MMVPKRNRWLRPAVDKMLFYPPGLNDFLHPKFMTYMKQDVQFALDKFTKTTYPSARLKYIAKGYSAKGAILYYDEGETGDGFGDFIRLLEVKKSAELFVPENSLQATLAFINELKHTVENASLTLLFSSKNRWKKIVFTF